MLPLRILLSWRLLILAWLIAWMTTIPLFHIHIPDTTDRWSVLQSAGAHTVLTPDLPGEFSPPFHDNQAGHSGHLSQRSINSPELGIALIDEKSDDRRVEARSISSLPSRFADASLLSSVRFELPWPCWKPHLSRASSAERAPPRVLSHRIYTS